MPAYLLAAPPAPAVTTVPRADDLGAPLLVEQVGLRVGQRRERAGDPFQELIGEAGIAREHRAVQVGADDPAADDAVGGAAAVGCGAERRPRPAPIAVTPRWFSKPTSQPVPSASSRTATSPTSRFGARVVTASTRQRARPTEPSAVDERRPDELEAGAHREHGAAPPVTASFNARRSQRFERRELR